MTVCTCYTDDIGEAYSLVFLLLGSSTLCGGLAITFSHLRAALLPLWYVAVPAWLYRTLLIADLGCCHLHATCEEVRNFFSFLHDCVLRRWSPQRPTTPPCTIARPVRSGCSAWPQSQPLLPPPHCSATSASVPSTSAPST